MHIIEASLLDHPDDSGIRIAKQFEDDTLLEIECSCGHFIQFLYFDTAEQHDCEWCEEVRLVLI